jgi:hypothetical protein
LPDRRLRVLLLSRIRVFWHREAADLRIL